MALGRAETGCNGLLGHGQGWGEPWGEVWAGIVRFVSALSTLTGPVFVRVHILGKINHKSNWQSLKMQLEFLPLKEKRASDSQSPPATLPAL